MEKIRKTFKFLDLAVPGVLYLHSQFSPVTQSCLTLCNPMNHSTPGRPVHHPHKDMHLNVHTIIIFYSPKLETIHLSTD